MPFCNFECPTLEKTNSIRPSIRVWQNSILHLDLYSRARCAIVALLQTENELTRGRDNDEKEEALHGEGALEGQDGVRALVEGVQEYGGYLSEVRKKVCVRVI